jgi:Ca-activated chloride channel family protein
LKYQKETSPSHKSAGKDEILTVKFRYKEPIGNESKLIEHAVKDQLTNITGTSDNFRFAAAVSEFGMLLRNSEFKSAASFENVIRMARKARGNDEEGYRAEFIRLAEAAELLAKGVRKEPSKEILGKR